MRIRAMLVASAMFGTVLAAPVAAQAGREQCQSNKQCVWGNNNFNWLIAAQYHGQGVVDVFNNANGENNQGDSWSNRSASYAGCLYDGDNGSSALLTMGKTSSDGNMWFGDSDKTSSMKTNGPC